MMNPGELLAQLIKDALIRHARGEIGILVRQVPALDGPALLKELAALRGETNGVRAALLGIGDSAELAQAADKLGYRLDDDFTTAVEVAEQWRNQRGLSNMVVIAPTEHAKLTSLEDLALVTSIELKHLLSERAIREIEGLEEYNEVQPRWWTILGSDPRVSLSELVDYYLAQVSIPFNERVVRSAQDLWRLGLLPDPHLFDRPAESAIERRLGLNRSLMDTISQMTPSTRRKVGDRISREPSEVQRRSLRQVFRQIQALYEEGSQALQRLQLDGVASLLRVKGDPQPRQTKVDIEGRVIEILLSKENEVAERVREWIDTLLEELADIDERTAPKPKEMTIEETTSLRLIATARPDLIQLSSVVLTEERLGALARSDNEEAEAAVRKFSVEDLIGEVGVSEIQQYLQYMASTSAGVRLKARFDAFVDARHQVMSIEQGFFVRGLLTAPILMLADPTNRKVVRDYVEAFRRLCEEMNLVYQDLFNEFIDNVRQLYARLILTDIILFQTPRGRFAVTSPLHPLWLWHYVSFLDLLVDQAEALTEGEKNLLSRRALPLPNLVESISVTQPLTGAGTVVLLSAGSIGVLPYYAEQQVRPAPADRLGLFSDLVRDFLALFPYAKPSLRLVAVEPPNLAALLQAISGIADSGAMEGVRLFVFTKDLEDQSLGARLSEEQEEEISRRFSSHAKGRRFSIEFETQYGDWTAEQIAQRRPHIVLLFDQSPRVPQGMQTGTQPAHPLVIPRQFQYSIANRQIELIPEPGGILGAFYRAANQFDQNAGPSYAVVHQQADLRQRLNEVSQKTPWLIIVDQNIDGDLDVGSLRIFTGREDDRHVAAFAQSRQPFRQVLRRVVQTYNTAVTDAELDDLLGDLSNLLNAGVLALRPGVNPRADLARVKGILGTLIAARWYRSGDNDRILVSLDSAEARQWLNLEEADPLRADLLGIEWDEEHSRCFVDVIEAKAVEQASLEYQVTNGSIAGPAVEQILQTAALLRPAFERSDQVELITVPVRREILKDHLLHESSKPMYQDGQREQWSRRLRRIFRGDITPRLRLTLVDVSIGAQVDATPAAYDATDPQGNSWRITVVHQNESRVGALVAHAPEPDEPEAPPPPAAPPTEPEPPQPATAPMEPTAPPAEAVGNLRVMLGKAQATAGVGAEIWYDPYKQGRPLANPHIMITGGTGTGKTQAIKAVAREMSQAGLPLLFLDFKDDYAIADYAERENLQVFNTSVVGLPFNPLRPIVDLQSGMVLPMNHIYHVTGILGRILNLGVQQRNRLRQAIRQTYQDSGIGTQPFAFTQPFTIPAFSVLEDIIRADVGNEELLGRLAPLFDLQLFRSSDESQFESLMESQVVIRLSLLPSDEIKAIVAEFLLMALYNYMIGHGHVPQLRRLLVLDEAWRITNSPFLEPLIREGRALGIGVVIASQYPRDLQSAVRGATNTKIFFSNDQPEDVRLIQQMLLGTTSGSEANNLGRVVRRLQPFECLITNGHYQPFQRMRFQPYFERLSDES